MPGMSPSGHKGRASSLSCVYVSQENSRLQGLCVDALRAIVMKQMWGPFRTVEGLACKGRRNVLMQDLKMTTMYRPSYLMIGFGCFFLWVRRGGDYQSVITHGKNSLLDAP